MVPVALSVMSGGRRTDTAKGTSRGNAPWRCHRDRGVQAQAHARSREPACRRGVETYGPGDIHEWSVWKSDEMKRKQLNSREYRQ
ncbi:MAG: hypothetical protein PVSMB1_02380 [Gemmatimonadaceae bacterium]